MICVRCGKAVVDDRGGCEGAQHGNTGCALNNPEAVKQLPVGWAIVKASSRRDVLLHRLRRHRDMIPVDKYHSCHPGCLNTDCLIISALRFIEEETHAHAPAKDAV